MGSQRPLGCASGIRRTVTPVQLPAACVRGSNSLKLGSLRRRLVRPSAAIGFSDVLAGPWSDADAGPLPMERVHHDAAELSQPRPVLTASTVADSQVHSQRPSSHQQEQLRTRQQQQLQQQQKHEAAQQLVQRLVPTTPVASATKLPTRGGVGAGGVALGILLTVALQLVGRWLQRQRWAMQLMELLDLRRSSGSAASTSGKYDSDGDARRPPGGGSSSSSGRVAAGDGDAASGDADLRSAFLGGGGGAGSLPGSPLGTMDSGGAGGLGAGGAAAAAAAAAAQAAAGGATGASTSPVATDPGESVEWVNMCWRKVWRVYQRGLERWIIDLLQPVFDGLVKDGSVPRWLCRLRVVELTLDHEAPYFSNMRRRNSRKDSDLNGVVDLRYTGGARMLLMLELGEGRWRFKVPVLVSDLDLECQMWLKLRLAPMCPWIGTISLAFVGPPNVKVQLSPYNRVRLMRVPVVQNYLRKLLTVDLPGLMVLPQRLEINIPPSVTTIAEAAVGRDTIMRAVASAVLQADAVEAALLAALPLGPQTPAGGVTLPEAFKGELSVTLREARNLPVWGFPGQSNPYCRLVLGDQAVQSRREGDTSHPGRHRAPVWNQEFQFLVEDPQVQVLEMLVKDSHLTGRTEVGRASIRLVDILAAMHSAEGGKLSMWIPLQPPAASYAITGGEAVPTGDVLVELSYKAFDDDEQDSGYREAENYSKQAAAQAPITDIRSAAAASSRAAVAASAAVSAIAMTRAAAARAAARAARAAQEAAAAAAGAAKGAVDRREPPAAQTLPPPAKPAALLPPPKQQEQQTPVKAAAKSPTEQDAAARSSAAESLASEEQQAPAAAPPTPTPAVVSLPAAGRIAGGAFEAAAASGSGANGSGAGGAAAAQPLGHVAVGAAMTAPGIRERITSDGEAHYDGGADELRVLAEEMQNRALAAAPSATAAAAAVAIQSPTATRTATAVLERPPAPATPHVTDGGDAGGNSGNGRSYDHQHQSYDAKSGDKGSSGSRWRRRQSDDEGSSPHAPPSNDGRVADGATDAPSAVSLSVEVLEPLAPPPSPSELPQRPLQHNLEEPPTIDVAAAAEVVMGRDGGGAGRSGSGSGGSPSARAPPPAPGGAAAAGGPVLSALAHLTASAHSLTATAIDKAREALSQKQQQQSQQQQEEDEGATAAAAKEKDDSGSGNWLEAIVSRLPRYGGGPQQNHHQHAGGGGSEEEEEAAAAAAAGGSRAGAGDSGDEEHPWWQFWVPKGGVAKLHDAADGDAATATDAAAASSSSPSSSPNRGAGGDGPPEGARSGGSGKPWWQFWPDGEGRDREGEEGEEARRAQGGAAAEGEAGSKPVEAIYIPADLPLEEIAAEVQRLKEDNWRERSDHVSSLWMKAVERNDRKWLMLAAFLLSVAVGLLTVVAWRLEQLEHLQAAAPQVALLTMQAALQALEQHASSGGGGGGLPL